MIEQAALLRNVIAFPREDHPRLVYADWLDEHGEEERAEFIRVQCALAQQPVCDWVPTDDDIRRLSGEHLILLFDINNFGPEQQRIKLRDRERALFKQHAAQWKLDAGLTLPIEILFTRGFISEITCSWSDWLGIERTVAWCPKRCGRCEGNGMARGHERSAADPHQGWIIRECPTCQGTGSVDPIDECHDCGGSGMSEAPDGDIARTWPCDACDMTGRIPRPLPITAQPIETVRLTDDPIEWLDREPGFNGWRIRGMEHRGYFPTHEYAMTDIAEEWPGITFHLPQGATR